MRGVAAQAIARIDLRSQRGEHPRIGALDVVPFVPLGRYAHGRVHRACPRLRRLAGAAVRAAGLSCTPGPPRDPTGGSWPTSVGLVSRACRRPLPPTDGAPDYGPRRTHPTAGATVVGARPFLIAWNIQLESEDLGLARRIASQIRERDGGLPAVQALGIPLVSQGCVQVSMNLLDHGRTPMWRVFERFASSRRLRAPPSAIRSSSGWHPSSVPGHGRSHRRGPTDGVRGRAGHRGRSLAGHPRRHQ